MIIAQATGRKKANRIKNAIIPQDKPPGIISSMRFKPRGLFNPLLRKQRFALGKRLGNQPFEQIGVSA